MPDKNTPIPLLLVDGPCDGRKVTGERGPDFPLDYTCKGVEYQYTGKNRPDGRYIYKPLSEVQPPPKPPPPAVAAPSRAHSAWHNLLVSLFVESPKELQRSAQARLAIRRLAHRRGLR